MNPPHQTPYASDNRPVEMARAVAAIRRIRVVRVGLLEGALVDLMADALVAEGLQILREVTLGPRCRIDLTVASGDGMVIGIEAKRGRPGLAAASAQIRRYAGTGRLSGIIFVAERTFDLPLSIEGIPVAAVSLQSLMGIAL